MKDYFIQEALKNHKKGALHRELEIPIGVKIPKKLINAIHDSDIGSMIHNPTNEGKREIHVTRLEKERADLARTLGNLRKK